MQRLALAIFLSCATANSLAAPAYQGMSYTAFGSSVLNTPGSDQSLLNMSILGTDTVALNVWWYQDEVDSNTMYSDPNRSATIASVEHAIDDIQGLGMKVFLKPMLDVQDGTWRANILPTDANTWFSNYTNFIGMFADLAQAKGVELFSVGTELNRMEAPENTQRWIDLVADVRSRYDGAVTYAANWNDGSIGGGYDILPWWNQVDYVGIDAYFPVTGSTNPSLAQMQAAWEARADQIDTWRQTQGLGDKHVIFTEAGLPSYDGANVTPFALLADSPNPSAPADELEQANGYEALLSVMSQRDWWDGAFWWNWETNPNTGSTTSFTPQSKLAQDVLAEYYGGELPPFPTSSWNAGTGSAGTAANWTGGTPNAASIALFARGATESYTLQLNTGTRTVGQLRVGSNTVTLASNNTTVRNLTADDWHFDDENRAIVIGVDAGDVAVVTTASTFGTLLGRAATLGDAAGASGTLNLTSSTNLLNVNGSNPAFWEFIVGRAGTGTLNVTGGARVTVGGSGASSVMGLEAGSTGTAMVSGTGSLWSSFIALRVGIEGQALLTVANGGTVSAPTIVVGALGEVRGNGKLTGSVTNNGVVAPGTSPGRLSVSGSFTQASIGKLAIELASTSSFDSLQIGGAVSLDGTVGLHLVDGYLPAEGDSFDILDWGSSFTDAGFAFDLPTLAGDLDWDTSQFRTAGIISVVASIATLSGDYNGDGMVDAEDYTVWRDMFGETGDDLAADGSSLVVGTPDGVVDEQDYVFWKSHFGESTNNGSAALTSVPEPHLLAMALVTLALVSGVWRLERQRYRKSSSWC